MAEYTTREMMEAYDQTPPVRSFLQKTFFPGEQTHITEKVEFDVRKGKRIMAPFVSPRKGGKVIKRQGFRTNQFTTPKIAPERVLTIDDITKRAIGENIYSQRTPEERENELLAKDMTDLEESIARRKEWMCRQILFEGKIDVVDEEEGVDVQIDFGFDNIETIVTDALKWTSPTSHPLADIERWRKKVQKTGFVNCNICIMASDVSAAFINHPEVKELLDVDGYDLAAIKPRELPDGSTYIGTIRKLALDIYEYNEWYLDDWTNPAAPDEYPLVPDGALALMSTRADYSEYYGAITMIPEEGKKFVTVEGDMVPQTWIERRPDRRFLQINSKPLPVPHEVNSWFVAHVL